jgi:3-isopropylmalate/(R)-2-methylmalate dehydratase large subunit
MWCIRGSRRHRAALHRPSPRPRSHQPAGLRGSQARRAQALARRLDRRHGGPQHTHRDWDSGHPRPDLRACRSRRSTRTSGRTVRLAYFPFLDGRQGIVHVIGPGDRRDAARHDRRLRRFAHEHARRVRLSGAASARPRSSTCWPPSASRMKKSKAMLVRVDGALGRGCQRQGRRARVIGRSAPPAARATRSSSAGSVIRGLSMEGRMTLCNMAIEAGARAGMVGADEKTIAYVRGRTSRRAAISGIRPPPTGGRCIPTRARSLRPRGHARGEDIAPQVTWGTSPEMVDRSRQRCRIRGRSPTP